MAEYSIDLQELCDVIPSLHAGDSVTLNGIVYTARDAAHKRMKELMDLGEKLPFDLAGATIYYAGPTPAREGQIIGACGPTTSGRMDPYTPTLLDRGLKGIIGKGQRSREVQEAIVRNKAVYFAAIGGAGAFYADCVKSLQVIAFDDLGCESVKRLEIRNFAAVVAMDSFGENLYETGRKAFER